MHDKHYYVNILPSFTFVSTSFTDLVQNVVSCCERRKKKKEAKKAKTIFCSVYAMNERETVQTP